MEEVFDEAFQAQHSGESARCYGDSIHWLEIRFEIRFAINLKFLVQITFLKWWCFFFLFVAWQCMHADKVGQSRTLFSFLLQCILCSSFIVIQNSE